MVDKVSFGGFKNTGARICDYYDKNNKFLFRILKLNTELTNDALGNDLLEISSLTSQIKPKLTGDVPEVIMQRLDVIASKSELTGSDNRLDVVLYLSHSPEGYSPIRYFLVNNKLCEVKSENLKVFEKIADLFKKIVNTKNENFVLDRNYFGSGACKYNMMIKNPVDIVPSLHDMHRPAYVKWLAQGLVDGITQAVAEFLGC